MAHFWWIVFWIFVFSCNLTVALTTIIDYEFDFKCGKQPVTGELVVEKGNSILLNMDLKRPDQNKLKESREYLDVPLGEYKLILRTGCGALSKIGELCHHQYTVTPFYQLRGTSSILVYMNDVDLHHEIGNYSSKIELVCT